MVFYRLNTQPAEYAVRYNTILFDADGTLLDFHRTEQEALRRAFAAFQLPFDEGINERYQRVNRALWESFERGEMEKDEVVHTRFRLLFQELAVEIDPIAFETAYQAMLGEGFYLIEGAKALCEKISEDARLYLVTNGVSRTQHSRWKGCGLKPYFQEVFVSEDTGFQKPMKGYFDYVFARIPDLDLSRTLIVGDSLTSDIAGGNAAGIDSCWYNPGGEKNDTAAQPDYEIKKLKDLINIVYQKEEKR